MTVHEFAVCERAATDQLMSFFFFATRFRSQAVAIPV